MLTAMVMRLDGTVGLVLTELRAMHRQYQRLANPSAVLRSNERSRRNDSLLAATDAALPQREA